MPYDQSFGTALVISRVSLVKLRRDLDRERALELWSGEHADVVRELPGIDHYSVALALEPRSELRWDAVATIRGADRAGLEAALGAADVQRRLLRTRQPFLERAEVFYAEEHLLIDGGRRP